MYLNEFQVRDYLDNILDFSTISDRTCPICLEDIEHKNETILFENCRHVEHKNCSDTLGKNYGFRNNSCSMCFNSKTWDKEPTQEVENDSLSHESDTILTTNMEQIDSIALRYNLDFRHDGIIFQLPEDGWYRRKYNNVTVDMEYHIVIKDILYCIIPSRDEMYDITVLRWKINEEENPLDVNQFNLLQRQYPIEEHAFRILNCILHEGEHPISESVVKFNQRIFANALLQVGISMDLLCDKYSHASSAIGNSAEMLNSLPLPHSWFSVELTNPTTFEIRFYIDVRKRLFVSWRPSLSEYGVMLKKIGSSFPSSEAENLSFACSDASFISWIANSRDPDLDNT